MNVYFSAYKIGSGFGSIKLRVVLAFAREGTQITHTNSLHNAEILSSSSPTRPE
jgi:hypothetical protein